MEEYKMYNEILTRNFYGYTVPFMFRSLILKQGQFRLLKKLTRSSNLLVTTMGRWATTLLKGFGQINRSATEKNEKYATNILSPSTNKYLVQNVSSSKVEKLKSRWKIT